MINYMTRHMVAVQAMAYAGQELMPGDSFFATPDDEGYFTRNGRARPAGPAQQPRRFVPVSAPIGETATLVPVLVLDLANAGAAASAGAAEAAASASADQAAAEKPAPSAPAEAVQAQADTAAKPTDEAAPAAAAGRPAQAARARTRLLTSTGDASS